MGFNLQPGGGGERSGGLASVGDATPLTGPGPFVLDAMTDAAYSHYFRYTGTDAVDVTLPSYVSDAWWSAGYLFAVVNVGSGGASVEVFDGQGVTTGITLAPGEGALFAHRFDGYYDVVAVDQATGGPSTPPAWPLGYRYVSDANLTASFADGTTVIGTVATGRTFTLPLITAGDVGKSIYGVNIVESGGGAQVTIAASGGQTIRGSTGSWPGNTWRRFTALNVNGTLMWISAA